MVLQEGAVAGHQPLFMVPILHHFRAVTSLSERSNGTFVDCTFGRGGHSRILLKHLSGLSRLFAMDVDSKAFDVAQDLAKTDSRLQVFKMSYANLSSILKDIEVDGVLINGGITTDSKLDPERGIRRGPLDLRYDNQVRFEVCSAGLASTLHPPYFRIPQTVYCGVLS